MKLLFSIFTAFAIAFLIVGLTLSYWTITETKNQEEVLALIPTIGIFLAVGISLILPVVSYTIARSEP
jgi:hypothetical protein